VNNEHLPLKGLKIIALEQYGAAPFGTMFLADLGADVIKVENHLTGGEMGRHVVPYSEDGDSLFFQSFSANKRSIGLNIKSSNGRKILDKLVSSSDALINNLRGDLVNKLGLNYKSFSKHKPEIVCVHLSAYGRNNSRASWPGLDYVMQAEAGYLSVTGEPSSPPTRFGLSIVDYQAGLTAALALLAGILGAQRTGRGQDYDAALFDVAMTNLSYPATWHLTEGYKPERIARSGHPSLVPSELYKTKNGWIFIMANKDSFWPKLVTAIEKPQWIKDPRISDFKSRLKNRQLVVELLSEVFIKENTEYWLSKLTGLLPCAPVNNIESALSNKFSDERMITQKISHPKWQNMKVVRQPILADENVLPRKKAPLLGEDTINILKEIGYEEEEINTLLSDKTIFSQII
tara:strand:+ start:17329 stop:18540 length:1212 start_codon:yes stop_codon:yes gene_type:complete